MAEDTEFRELFIKTAYSFLDQRVSAKMRPVTRNMLWITTYCLNRVRKAQGLDPVSKTATDLFSSLDRDLEEKDLRIGDIVFFLQLAPVEILNLGIISRFSAGPKAIGIAGNRVVELEISKYQFRVPFRVVYRSSARWFFRLPELVHARTSLPGFQHTKTFYITQGNNSDLVQAVLEAEGYRRVGTQLNAGIIWTQLLRQVDFESVKEGKQLVNHIPRMQMLITTKKSFRHTTKQIANFPVPPTYDLSDQFDYVSFMSAINGSHTKWILKPFALNQGIGITLVSNVAQFRKDLQTGRETRQKVIQLYIANPLLLDGHKFDIRYYVLIVRCKPVVVLRYDEFYVRRSLNAYSVNSESLLTHLTNAHQQKSHPSFNDKKEDSIYSKRKLEEGLGSAVVAAIERGIVDTLTKLFAFTVPQMEQRLGSFELLGVDFMLDSSMRLYMLEANTNPALYTDTLVLQTVIPKMMRDTILAVSRAHAGHTNFLEDTAWRVLFPIP